MRVTGFKQLAVQIGCDGGVTVAVDVRVAYEIDQIMCSSLSTAWGGFKRVSMYYST